MSLIGTKSMENTYNYLKNAYLRIGFEIKQNPLLLLLVFVLLSLPFHYVVNSRAVGLFVILTLIKFKKSNFNYNIALVFPVLLYILMVFSLIWSRDFNTSLKALSKELPLFVIPICFMIFKPFSKQEKNKIFKLYSFGMFFFVLFYIVKSIIKFCKTRDSSVFFYHELVTEDINAIHVSVYVAIAFFYFYTKQNQAFYEKTILFIFGFFIFLLASKNIIVVFIMLVLFYEFFYNKNKLKTKWIFVSILFLGGIFLFFSPKIKNRFLIEFQSNQNEGRVNKDFGNEVTVNNVTIKEAWTKQKFQQNDYFPGTAFRVYQARIFKEMLQEDPVFYTGYGLNATNIRIEEKATEHNIFLGDATSEGYQKKNFHNQYIQIFAETGVFGFIILILMVGLNLKNAIRSRNFHQISFAVLIISLFFTESFLSRQRGIVFFVVVYCLFNSKVFSKEIKF
jgi:O-antigen ligase